MYDITILLSWQHNHYTGHLTRHIWHHSHCFCVITQMANTSVSMYRSIDDIRTICKSSHFAHIWHHTQSTSHHIHTIWYQWSYFMISHTRHSWHQISSLWHHIHSLGHHTTLCMISSSLYLTSRPLYLCHHTHLMDDITATTWEVLHSVYLWHHIPYVFGKISAKVWHHNTLCWCHHTRHMCDILCTADDITYTLSHKTTVFMMSHPFQAWHHTPCIRHCTHCIFVITTSPLISHPLLNDLTPTFCVT